MIEVLKQKMGAGATSGERLNLAREFLQLLALRSLSGQDAFSRIAFVGGTALRVLFGLRRFSEDLDFSVTHTAGYDFGGICGGLAASFRQNGLNAVVEKRSNGAAKAVDSCFLAFPGLPYTLGFSGHREEKLSIKVEVDTRPPRGWMAQTSVINNTYLFSIAHYDLPSLFAGKLHACFYRRYTKGRDIYDLFWYLGRKARPNFEMLNNAVAQTQGEAPGVNGENFREFMLGRLALIDLAAAKKDVERFLEDKSELRLFDKKTLIAAVNSATQK